MIFYINEKYKDNFKVYKQLKGHVNYTLTIHRVKPTCFFSKNFLMEFLTYLNDNRGSSIVLIYKGFSWQTIKLAFINGIQISEGNHTLKHILSPP